MTTPIQNSASTSAFLLFKVSVNVLSFVTISLLSWFCTTTVADSAKVQLSWTLFQLSLNFGDFFEKKWKIYVGYSTNFRKQEETSKYKKTYFRWCTYQAVSNISFSENFGHVVNGWSLAKPLFHFCLMFFIPRSRVY